jgi:hypothetical protein
MEALEYSGQQSIVSSKPVQALVTAGSVQSAEKAWRKDAFGINILAGLCEERITTGVCLRPGRVTNFHIAAGDGAGTRLLTRSTCTPWGMRSLSRRGSKDCLQRTGRPGRWPPATRLLCLDWPAGRLLNAVSKR